MVFHNNKQGFAKLAVHGMGDQSLEIDHTEKKTLVRSQASLGHKHLAVRVRNFHVAMLMQLICIEFVCGTRVSSRKQEPSIHF